MTHIERSVHESERSAYLKWLSSKSISTPDSDEMVIAWNIAQTLDRAPNAVIRAARGQRGQERLRPLVESFVEQCPDIAFARDGAVRRLRFRGTIRETA